MIPGTPPNLYRLFRGGLSQSGYLLWQTVARLRQWLRKNHKTRLSVNEPR
jgi:hypothetical protein